MKRVSTGALVYRLAVLCLAGLTLPGCVLASGVTVIDLGNLGGGKSIASFINNEGDVTGSWYLDASNYHAFLYNGITTTIRDIGTFGGSLSSPKGLNAYGDVSGTADTVDSLSGNTFVPNAFIYHNGTGTLTNLGTLGGTNSFGNGLNDSGTVVGQGWESDNSTSHATLSSTPYPAAPRDLGTLGGSSGHADFINNAGQIAGNANLSGDHSTLAFYSQNGSSLVSLSLGGNSSTSYGINASGLVIGKSSLSTGVNQHGLVYNPNAPVPCDANNPVTLTTCDLHTLIFNGTTYVGASDAEAINNQGEVVGESDYAIGNSGVSSGHHHAYSATFANSMWTMTDLDALAGYSDSVATAINNEGEIVGTAGSGNTSAAFLYLSGQMLDLTSLLPANSGFTQLLTATGINDNGVIIGQGITNSGAHDAFVFTYSAAMTPEPSTLVLLALGLLFGGLRLKVWRKRCGDC